MQWKNNFIIYYIKYFSKINNDDGEEMRDDMKSKELFCNKSDLPVSNEHWNYDILKIYLYLFLPIIH